MISTYTFHKTPKGATTLRSSTGRYRLSVEPKRGYWYATIQGPGFRKSGLTSISGDLSSFEVRAVLLFLYQQSRDAFDRGAPMPKLSHFNYTDVFGSCCD